MRLRFVATLAPPVAGFGPRDIGDEISFLPLDRIWADSRFDPTQTLEFSGDVASYNPVNEGDLLVPKVSPTFAHGRTAIARGLAGGRALATSEVFVVRANDPRDASFLKYRMIAPDFLAVGQSAWTGVAGLKRVPADFLKNVTIGAVAWWHRREIAELLNRECARIERVAAAQAKLSSLGAEAITSACAAMFSGGGAATIDGDYGVRLRFLVREVDERAKTRGLPLLSVTIDRGVVRRDQLTNDLPRAIDLSNYKSVAARDIVVNRMRAFQGAVGVASEDGIVSPDYLVLRMRSDNDPRLVAGALASQRGADVMASLIRGIGGVDNGAVRTPRINTSDLLDVPLRVPPAAEQAQIVAALQRAERDSQALGRVATAVGQSLTAYRDSLIHEAVTGKLDVTKVSDRQMDERLHAAAEDRLDEVAAV